MGARTDKSAACVAPPVTASVAHRTAAVGRTAIVGERARVGRGGPGRQRDTLLRRPPSHVAVPATRQRRIPLEAVGVIRRP